MENRLANYKRLAQKPIGYQQYFHKNLDYRANIFNTEAKSFYENCGCNVTEMAIESKNKVPSGIELMRTKHCLKYAADLCQKPCKKLYLVDHKGKKYPLKFDCKNCEMAVLSP